MGLNFSKSTGAKGSKLRSSNSEAAKFDGIDIKELNSVRQACIANIKQKHPSWF